MTPVLANSDEIWLIGMVLSGYLGYFCGVQLSTQPVLDATLYGLIDRCGEIVHGLIWLAQQMLVLACSGV